ncbi:AIPR family protein [Kribbella swartbergensis]
MPVGPDFVPWMQGQVERWADRYGTDARRAFPAWCLNFIFDVDDDDAFVQTDTLTQGDAGLDGWYLNRDSRVFHLVQAKYLDNPLSGAVKPGVLDSLLRAALLLKNPAAIEDGPHRDKLTKIGLELEQASLDDIAVELDYFVAGVVSEKTKSEIAKAVEQLGSSFSVEIYDTARLSEIRLEDDLITDLKDTEVAFRVAGDDEYFERHSISLDGVAKVAVATFDGRSLADAVDAHGPRLFHSNVRYYLKRVNRVNKAMLATLGNDEEREAFWLYNNGITLVADSFEFATDNEATLLKAKNPQIVNGAQTSSVLRERRANLKPGDVSVQARIIAVTGDEAGHDALVQISEYTNSQSPVKPADLRANDRRHLEMQANFRMIEPPVFYERRRGEWNSLDKATQASFGKTYVTKENIGQRYLAYQGRPAESIVDKEAMFGELEKEAFDTRVSAYVFMLADTLYREIDRLMTASHTDELLGLAPGLGHPISAEPDSPTALDALRPVRKLVCAHGTALAAQVLKVRYHEIGGQRARVLIDRLRDEDDGTSRFILGRVFRAIRFWLTTHPDKTAIKKSLQRPDAIAQMIANLADVLADVDIKKELASIGADG